MAAPIDRRHEVEIQQFSPGLDLSSIQIHLEETWALLDDEITSNEHEAAIFELGESFSRQNIRGIPDQITNTCFDYIKRAAGFVLEHSAPGDEEIAINELTRHYLPSLPFEAHEVIKLGTQSQVQIMRTIDSLSDTVVNYLDDEIRDDTSKQYELMKMLSYKFVPSAAKEPFKDLVSLQILCCFADINDKSNNIHSWIWKGLNNGQYDHFIAEELIREALYFPEESNNDKSGRQYFELRRLISFAKSINQDLSEELAIKACVDALGSWPESSRDIFLSQKEQFIQNMESNQLRNKLFLKENGFSQDDFSEEKLLQAADNATTVIRRFALGADRRPSIEEIRMRAEIKKEKRRRKEAAQKKNEEARGTDLNLEASSKREPRSLAYIDASGNEISENEDEYKAMVGGYLKEHPESKNALSKDIDNIMEYLKMVDFSQGHVRGIKKYQNKVKRGEREFDLYALKPTDAVGLSTSSKIAKKTRVLFVFINDNKAGIIGIMDRDKVVGFEKSLGIESGSKR